MFRALENIATESNIELIFFVAFAKLYTGHQLVAVEFLFRCEQQDVKSSVSQFELFLKSKMIGFSFCKTYRVVHILNVHHQIRIYNIDC
jgi:hypothetical protein